MAGLRLKEAEAAAAHSAAALQLQTTLQAARDAEAQAQDLETRVASLQVLPIVASRGCLNCLYASWRYVQESGHHCQTPGHIKLAAMLTKL